jgi:hypothetical protein
MKDLTLYQICADDHYIFACLEKDKDVTVEVWNDNEEIVYKEKSHHFAWDSLVAFARMVLDQDKKIQEDNEAIR